MTAYMAPLAGWRVLSCGAYFALVTHPFDLPSDQVARNLVEDAALLTLPGTMFGPTRPQGGDGQAETTLRIAFANADEHGLQEMARRLGALSV